MYKSGDVIEIGCMAHVRRKFYDITVELNNNHQHLTYKSLAHKAMDLIDNIYNIEDNVAQWIICGAIIIEKSICENYIANCIDGSCEHKKL